MDTLKAIAVMQDEHSAWEYGNFGTQLPWVPLAGIAEEAGELSHAYLKLSQGIRGDAAKHKADACDAVGDILVYLVSYCTKMGFRFAQIITHGDMLGVDDPKSNWLQRDGLFYINRCIARLIESHVEEMDEEIVKSRVYDVVVSLSIFSANFLGGSKALTHLLTAWDEVKKREWKVNPWNGKTDTEKCSKCGKEGILGAPCGHCRGVEMGLIAPDPFCPHCKPYFSGDGLVLDPTLNPGE